MSCEEARRQQAMLAALLGGPAAAEAAAGALPQDWPRVLRLGSAGRGLAAYRANARLHAARALSAGFPTLSQLVGEADMPALAAAYLQAHPPTRGDLAWLGAQLPAFVAGSASLATEPYLADVARLDAAVAQAQTAADAPPDLAALALLAEHAPSDLRLRFAPGTQLLPSPHPIASIWLAHQAAPGEPPCADAVSTDRFAAVRAAFAHGQGEQALVWRAGWQVRVQALPTDSARFLGAALSGRTLDRALDAAGPGWDFGAWLAEALGTGLLLGAATRPAVAMGSPAAAG